MPNNPFANSHAQSQFATRSAKFDIGRVTQVKSHERGDKIVHYCKVKLNQMEVDREIPIVVSSHGDINPPVVDQYVVVMFKKGERPYVLGQWYPVEDDIEDQIVKNYEAGERILGHPETDSSILFEKGGDILSINAYDMNGGPDGGRLPNGDIRTHHGNWIYQKDEDIFVHPRRDMGGSTYGVADIHTGIIEAPSSPTTQYVETGFFPRQVEFTGTLHMNQWNDPYYTVEDAGGASNEAIAECTGTATMTPLIVHNSVSGATPDSTSTTPERTEKEPYTAEHRQNPTQHVQSKAWFANAGTDYRQYVGDAQVVRLIQGADAAMTEEGRVEAKVNYFDDTGFELEWFASSDESGSTYKGSGSMPLVEIKAYT